MTLKEFRNKLTISVDEFGGFLSFKSKNQNRICRLITNFNIKRYRGIRDENKD